MKSIFALILLTANLSFSSTLSSMDPCERTNTINLLKHHSIRADRDGFALRTDRDNEERLGHNFTNHVSEIFEAAQKWSTSALRLTNDALPVIRLLIHVHGGLNKWGDTVNRMELVRPIMNGFGTNDGDRYYPIFVAWPSDYFGSYLEHLYRLRQGQRVNIAYSIPTTPLIFAADLGHAIINLPIFWGRQAETVKNQTVHKLYAKNPKSLLGGMLSRNFKMAEHNRQLDAIITNFTFETGQNLAKWEIAKRRIAAGFWSPVRATLGTLGQGGMTAASWNVMRRRTSNLLYPPDYFEMRRNGTPGYKRLEENQPAELFFKMLLARIEAETNYQYQITFVGHSMGTMVINQLLNVHRPEWIRSRAIENIIYMGAACSVADCLATMTPLLQGYEQASGGTNPIPRFYNLTLHPLAEMSEEMFAPAVPAGSLLHLIDSHLQSPNTPLEKTMGSEANVFATIPVFSEIKDYCVFKGFDFRPKTFPIAHGDFSKSPFWRRDFRETIASDDQQRKHTERYADPQFKFDVKNSLNTYPLNWLDEYDGMRHKDYCPCPH